MSIKNSKKIDRNSTENGEYPSNCFQSLTEKRRQIILKQK